MAGVGRRGFAAVARAAMVATSHTHPGSGLQKDASPVMDGRRANAPKYLDLNTTMNHVIRGERLSLTIFLIHLWCLYSFVPYVIMGPPIPYHCFCCIGLYNKLLLPFKNFCITVGSYFYYSINTH
jgi:hypothetical protein